MKTLQETWEFLPMKSDKNSIHSYLPVYDEIFAPYKETAKNILEIGLFNGASFLMFSNYFSGDMYGVDCSETPHDGMADLRPLLISSKHKIFIIDAENARDVEMSFKNIKFDIIIEDAGHHLEQQLNLYSIFKPYLNEKALYIIEDIQDIDKTRVIFENIDPAKKVVIIDNREIKNRYDDVLVIITDKQ